MLAESTASHLDLQCWTAFLLLLQIWPRKVEYRNKLSSNIFFCHNLNLDIESIYNQKKNKAIKQNRNNFNWNVMY